MTLEPIVHVLSLRCDQTNADQRAKFREWPLLLRRFAALADS